MEDVAEDSSVFGNSSTDPVIGPTIDTLLKHGIICFSLLIMKYVFIKLFSLICDFKIPQILLSFLDF